MSIRDDNRDAIGEIILGSPLFPLSQWHIIYMTQIKTNWIFLGDNNFDKGLNIIVLLSIIETFKSRNGDKFLRVVNLWRYG